MHIKELLQKKQNLENIKLKVNNDKKHFINQHFKFN
ncbi:Uncharacterised protein (plasmid) [Mycoplasmopsis canis]|uniref:Uncharacterized protein n=1 Tax=Mycoplasmopsis canis TaxID=29555 RepID=A0A449AS26_9BACT|nr:Uncharacterised protein [Mycoplasmopsis canis]